MEKEIRITPPEGYEIDKENSTFDCIKFKPIKNRWKDDTTKTISGYYIDTDSRITRLISCINREDVYNTFATEKQAKSALAMARLSQIIKNDKRFEGVVTDEEWRNKNMNKFVIYRHDDNITTYEHGYNVYKFLAFHTADQRDLFLEENKDLIKDYLMI